MVKQTQKKVLFLITKSNWGGAQRYVYDLATHLDKDKYISLVVSGETGTLNEALSHQQVASINLPSLNNSLRVKDIYTTCLDLYRLLKDKKPDVLHANSSMAGFLGVVMGRLTRVPRVIFTAHGWAFNEERSFLSRSLFRVIHYLTVLLSDQTIAVSKAVVSDLKLPGVTKKMYVLYPGRTIGVMFDKESARKTLIEDFPFLKAYQDDTWIGTIGELHKIKQHDVLIKSMVELRSSEPNTRLIIIGSGAEKPKLEKLIQLYGLEDSVFLLGPIYEAARLLKAFDIFALASHSEAYGYVVHEAGLAGLPVVATKVGGLKEIIKDGESGILVPEKNPSAFSDNFKKLLNDPELRLKLATAHQKNMESRNLTKMVQTTEAIYAL